MLESHFDASTKTLVYTFSGRMDSVRSDQIEGELLQKLEERALIDQDIKVVFDLGSVEYIASPFIRICLAAAKGLQEGHFAIIHTHPLIKKIFKIAGLDELLNVS